MSIFHNSPGVMLGTGHRRHEFASESMILSLERYLEFRAEDEHIRQPEFRLSDGMTLNEDTPYSLRRSLHLPSIEGKEKENFFVISTEGWMFLGKHVVHTISLTGDIC